MALWGSTSTVAKLLLGVYGPLTLTWLRWLVVLLITAPFAWHERQALAGALRTHWRPLLLLSLSGGPTQTTLIFFGLNQSLAVHLGLLNSVIPVLILLMGWLFMKERLHGKEMTGVLISASGVLVILFQGSLAAVMHLTWLPGDPIILVGMVLWSLYTLNLNRRPMAISLTTLMFVIAAIGLPLTLPQTLWELNAHPLPAFTWRPTLGLLYMSAVTTLGAMVLYGFGVKRIGPAQAGIFIHLMPLFACVFASVFAGEALHPYHAAGFVLVASGAIISCYRPAPVISSSPPDFRKCSKVVFSTSTQKESTMADSTSSNRPLNWRSRAITGGVNPQPEPRDAARSRLQ